MDQGSATEVTHLGLIYLQYFFNVSVQYHKDEEIVQNKLVTHVNA